MNMPRASANPCAGDRTDAQLQLPSKPIPLDLVLSLSKDAPVCTNDRVNWSMLRDAMLLASLLSTRGEVCSERVARYTFKNGEGERL